MTDSKRFGTVLSKERPFSGLCRLESKVEEFLHRFHHTNGHHSFKAGWFRKHVHGSEYYFSSGVQIALVLPWDRADFIMSAAAHGTPFGAGPGERAGRRFSARPRKAWVLFCIALVLTCSAAWKESIHKPELAVSMPIKMERTVRPQALGKIYSGLPTSNLWIRDDVEGFIRSDLSALMKEFGAEEYTVPPEFVTAVDGYVRRFQDSERGMMSRALVDRREIMDEMRGILREYHIPQDLAYMALIESNLRPTAYSPRGAAGFWQFTRATAVDFGMRVTRRRDDRLSLAKSTEGASRYMRELILEFGTGSSVMLAMAAYNGGPERVRRAVRTVIDPIKQRNFWYLYSTRALPQETREYVPKIMAAIVIGRNPQQFGFECAP